MSVGLFFSRASIVVIFLLLCTGLFGQTAELDSLQANVKRARGLEKIDALNALGFRQLLVDFSLAEQTIQQALELSQEEHYSKGLAESNIYFGIIENLRGNGNKSFPYFKTGIGYAQQLKLQGLHGYALTQLGNVYRNLGSYDSAIYWYDQSYSLLRDSLNPWQLSVYYRNRAILYQRLSVSEQEYTFLYKSYVIRKDLKDKVLLSDILILMAQWHIGQERFAEASAFLEKARGISGLPPESEALIKYEQAIVLFNLSQYLEALRLLKEVTDFYLTLGNTVRYVEITINVADMLEELGSHELSFNLCYEVIPICENKGLKNEGVRAHLILAWNYYDTRQFELAQETAEQVLSQSKQYKFAAEEAAAENLMGRLYSNNKNYSEALVHYKNGLTIRQRLKNTAGQANIFANMGDTYLEMGLYGLAADYVRQSMALNDSTSLMKSKPWNYLRLGNIAIAAQQYELADSYLRQIESIGNQLLTSTFKTALEFKIGFLQAKRKILMNRGKTQDALLLSLEIEEVGDALAKSSMTDRILRLEAMFKIDQQRKELLRQREEIAFQKSSLKKQQIILVSVLIGAFVLMGLLSLLFKYYSKSKKLNLHLEERNEKMRVQSELLVKVVNELNHTNRDLAEKNEEIQTQAEELTEANANLSYLNRELAEQQEELQAQSEELRESHDVIAQLNENLEQKVEERTQQMHQAFKELDTFFYRSSHDFRRPLTTFMGLAEVAKITVTDKNALDLFAKVKETAVNLDRMLIKLQSISDVGADQFALKPVDIKAIFENSEKTYSEALYQGKIKLMLNVEPIDSFVSYPAFLKIILDNLLENAIQFSKLENSVIEFEARKKDSGVEISVGDNGIGIDEEYKSRVFDMFFRASELSKGNGLGLYIVRKATEKLQGTLLLESKPQRGTRVTMWFPMQLG